LTGKVAIVTGGSEGIGYGCTHTLLSHNVSKVFILSLSQEVADGATKSLSEDLGPEAAQKLTWMKCDVGDWQAVAKAAEEIGSKTDRIDIMILNAGRGIMTYQLTDYGVDRHMAVNHFGHVIFASHLMPIMKKTAEKGNTVRIVTLGSNAHQATPSDCKFESLEELNQDLGPNGQYGRSKLAQMLYVKYLNKHLTQGKEPKILANTVHPGFVHTKMSQDDSKS
jgi:NAD(P)-dependent dehydrogenase (short-subunit alcohol dehydrogenase family)